MYYVTYSQGSTSWIDINFGYEKDYNYNTSKYEKWCARDGRDKYWNGCKFGYKVLCNKSYLYNIIIVELKIARAHG